MKNATIKIQSLEETGSLRVLVVDDHRYFRDSLASFLEEFSGVEVIGSAGDGKNAVEMVWQLHPDLVIMDIQMPEMDGLEACMSIKKKLPEIKVILYSMHAPEVFVEEGLKKADRFVPKDRLFEELPGLIGSLGQRLDRESS